MGDVVDTLESTNTICNPDDECAVLQVCKNHSGTIKLQEIIENYCSKTNLSLEILEYGVQAKIKMNNALYILQLWQYYTLLGGIVHTLELHNVVFRTAIKK